MWYAVDIYGWWHIHETFGYTGPKDTKSKHNCFTKHLRWYLLLKVIFLLKSILWTYKNGHGNKKLKNGLGFIITQSQTQSSEWQDAW